MRIQVIRKYKKLPSPTSTHQVYIEGFKKMGGREGVLSKRIENGLAKTQPFFLLLSLLGEHQGVYTLSTTIRLAVGQLTMIRWLLGNLLNSQSGRVYEFPCGLHGTISGCCYHKAGYPRKRGPIRSQVPRAQWCYDFNVAKFWDHWCPWCSQTQMNIPLSARHCDMKHRETSWTIVKHRETRNPCDANYTNHIQPTIILQSSPWIPTQRCLALPSSPWPPRLDEKGPRLRARRLRRRWSTLRTWWHATSSRLTSWQWLMIHDQANIYQYINIYHG